MESADFQICLPPPPSLQAHALATGVCASTSACKGDFVQAQALAGAISCKRKCLQGRFRASANACRGDFSHTGKHNAALKCAGRRDTSFLLVTLGDGHPGPSNFP